MPAITQQPSHPTNRDDFTDQLEELEEVTWANLFKINLILWGAVLTLMAAVFWLGWLAGDANGALRATVRHEIKCQQSQQQQSQQEPLNRRCPAGSIDTGASCQIQTKNLVL